MALVIGTDEGLYRVEEVPFEKEAAERTLDCGWVMDLQTCNHTEGIFVASETGAYRSTDGGKTWNDFGISGSDRYWYPGDSEI